MGAPTLVSYTELALPFSNVEAPRSTAAITNNSGDIFVVFAITANQAGTIALTDSAGLTWANPQTVNVGSFCWLSIWTATANGTSNTLTGTLSGTSQLWGFATFLFRGSDGVGNSYKSNSAAGQPKIASFVTTQENSAIAACWGDWLAIDGVTRDYLSGAGTFTEKDYYRNATQYTVYTGLYLDAGAAGTYSVGSSSVPTGQKWSIGAIEIKGAAGGAETITVDKWFTKTEQPYPSKNEVVAY